MLSTTLALLALPFVPPSGSALPTSTPDCLTRSDEHGRRAIARVDAQREEGSAVLALGALPAASWQALGPFGGDVADVAASPTAPGVVLAGLAPSSGVGGSLFRSTDGGASWSEVASLAGLSIYDLEFAPDGSAYAGTLDSVYKSTDGGASWTQQNLGIGANDQVLDLEIDPSDPSRIWAGVADALGNQTNTLLLSTDAGATWTVRVPAGGPYGFSSIAVHPSDSNRVYAAWQGSFGGGGVFVSSDGGLTWTDRSAGLPGNPMQDLEHDGARLLLCGGQLFGSQDVGVWTTSDEGLTWSELSTPAWPLRVLHDLEVEPGNPAHILAASAGNGIYESTDGGTTWSFGVGGSGGLSANEVSYDPLSANLTLHVGSSSNAVWRSTDGGSTYAPSSIGIGQLNVYSVATNPADPTELAVAYQGLNDGGVQSSVDGGLTWSPEAVPGTRWNSVRFDEGGTLYAISDGPTTVAPEALYRRSAGTWTSIGPDQGTLFESELQVMAFEPGAPSTIVAGGSDFGVAGHEPTLWRTTNGGATWTKTYEGPNDNEDVTDVEYVGGTSLLVASFTDFGSGQDGGALRSTDGGASWAESSTGLAAGCQGSSLAVTAQSSVVLLADADAGTGLGGLYASADAGASWALLNSAGTTRHVEASPLVTDRAFTTHFAAPVVRSSEDGGATLGDFSSGLSSTSFMRGLHLDAAGAVLYVATNEGAWRTLLGGGGLGVTYCFGDGSGTSCPCGNAGGAEEGCANSSGAGAALVAGGSLSVGADDLFFAAAGLLPGQPALLFSGLNSVNGGAGILFGDGLRCAGGTVKRLGVAVPDPAGSATWGPGLAAAGAWLAGETRRFQAWYRDPVGSPCGSAFNLSHGVELVFAP